MWDFDHDIIPFSLSNFFTRKNAIHNQQTRTATSGKLVIKATKTKKYGEKSFKIRGAKILNELKDKDIYVNAMSKTTFLNKLKQSYLDEY